MFVEWDWTRKFNGRDHDWKWCLDSICHYHRYSKEERDYLHDIQLCQDSEKMSRAKPKKHYLCRVYCNEHWAFDEGSCKIVVGSPSHYHHHIKQRHGSVHDRSLLRLFYKAAWTMWKVNHTPSKPIYSKKNPAVAAKPSIVDPQELARDMEIDNDSHGDNYIDMEQDGVYDVDDPKGNVSPGDDDMDVMDTISHFSAGMLPSTLSHIHQKFVQLIEPKPDEVSEFICRPCVKQRYKICIHQQ